MILEETSTTEGTDTNGRALHILELNEPWPPVTSVPTVVGHFHAATFTRAVVQQQTEPPPPFPEKSFAVTWSM